MKSIMAMSILFLGFGVAQADDSGSHLTCVGPLQTGLTRQVVEFNFTADAGTVQVVTHTIHDMTACGVHIVHEIGQPVSEEATDSGVICGGVNFVSTHTGEFQIFTRLTNAQNQVRFRSSNDPNATSVEMNCFNGTAGGVADFLNSDL